MINEIVTNKMFFVTNLKTILERIEESSRGLEIQMKSKGIPELDEHSKKEFLAKCTIETVNRFIF